MPIEYMKMEDIQRVSLDVLKKMTDIMDKQGLKYVLAYGTLIGAIRHKGSIPWDMDNNPKYPYMITRVSGSRYE